MLLVTSMKPEVPDIACTTEMSKKAKKRPTEASWDSDDDLLKEDASGVTAFSKAKGDEEEIDEEALLQIEGDEEIGEGDTFQILDPDVSAFDESVDLGLETSQSEQEALDYEDTMQEEGMEGTTEHSFSKSKIELKTEPVSVQSSKFSHIFKEVKKEESDSDEEQKDHRERFKSERKMISLKSTKYSKPIPETLEFTPEMQEELNRFEKKAPVKQRLGPRMGNQTRPQRPQNQRPNQANFGPRFPGNQNIIRPGPRGNLNQRQQNFSQRPGINQTRHPRNMVPVFPNEMNQIRKPGPVAQPGPGAPPMMPEPRPLLNSPPHPNIHVNPQFRGLIPIPEHFQNQPRPFNQGPPFQPPPHSQPNHYPRESWPPQQPGPGPQGYPPLQHNHPPYTGAQPPYPPASVAYSSSPQPGPPQPLIPTSAIPPGPHPHPHTQPQTTFSNHANGLPGMPVQFAVRPQGVQSHPASSGPPGPPHSHLQPPFPSQSGGPPGMPVRPQGVQVRPQQGIQVRPQQGIQVRPQQGFQVRPQQGVQVRPQQGFQTRPQGRQIRAQVGLKRAKGVFGKYGARLTGVGRGQFKQQQNLKSPMNVKQKVSAVRTVQLPRQKGFNPTPNQLTQNTNLAQGNRITVVNSRGVGVKRPSTGSANVIPVKQVKKEESQLVVMEPVDPELQKALEEQKRQREAVKLKKEQNRLALAEKRRQELAAKVAVQGMAIKDPDKQTGPGVAPQGQGQVAQQQGQKISVLGTQYPNANVNQNAPQYTNIVPVQTTTTTTVVGAQTVPGKRGKKKLTKAQRKARARRLSAGAPPSQQTVVSQQAVQQFQKPNPPQQVVPPKQPKLVQVQGQKAQVKPVNIVRSDSTGRVVQTYSAMPTKDAHGKTVYKLKIQDPGVQKRTVQATSPPSNRTVVAGSGLGGHGQVERAVIAHSKTDSQESSRTVVATGRTISIGSIPHLRSRKVSVEGLTSTTQETKLLAMVKNIGLLCEEIKIIPAQRRAIIVFQNIEMATKFVKKYNRTMVDLTKIQVKEVPE